MRKLLLTTLQLLSVPDSSALTLRCRVLDNARYNYDGNIATFHRVRNFRKPVY